MPPMMFTDEEALGLSLGLVAARGLGLSGVTPAVEGALAKVERVMPESLRRRLRVLEQTVELTSSRGWPSAQEMRDRGQPRSSDMASNVAEH